MTAETKRPAIASWNEYSTRPLTDDEKAKFLDEVGQGKNYAVPGGQHGLVILDFEDYNVARAWIGEKELEELCKTTLCVSTPHGGLHIYLISKDIPPHKFNPAFVNSEGKGVVDLQSYNSYVVGPWSCINHKHCDTPKCPYKGQDYVTCYTPKAKLEEAKIAEFDLRGLLRELAERGKKLGIEPSPRLLEWLGRGKNDTDEELEKLKNELAKYDRFRGKSVESVRRNLCVELESEIKRLEGDVSDEKKKKHIQVIETVYQVVCEGKTFHEVGIDRSRGDWRVIYTLLLHGVTNLDVIKQLLPEDTKINAPKWDKYEIHTIKKAWESVKPILEFRMGATNKREEKELKRLARSVITNYLIKKYRIRTFYQVVPGDQYIINVFRWDKKRGIYAPLNVTLTKKIREVAEKFEIYSPRSFAGLSKYDVVDIYEEILDKTKTELPEIPLRIAFKNATLEWVRRKPKWIKAEERKPKHFAFYYVPWNVNYEEVMKYAEQQVTAEIIEDVAKRLCPKALSVFRQWANEKWITLFELIGYILYPDIIFKKAFLLKGPKDSGKTTFIQLIHKIFGMHASAIPLPKLVDYEDRFIISQLYLRLVNAVSEVQQFEIKDLDSFKRLTGGDPVTVDRKFKDPIHFKPIAKQVVATNSFPKVKGTPDDAFWDRWLVIEFPNRFPQGGLDIHEVIDDKEIEGILTVSVLAFLRVLQQLRFDYQQEPEQVRAMWIAEGDCVYRFINDSVKRGLITVDPKNGDYFVPRERLYEMYLDYYKAECEKDDKQGKAESLESFVYKLNRYFGVRVSRKTVGRDEDGRPIRDRVIVGIRINEDDDNEVDEAGETEPSTVSPPGGREARQEARPTEPPNDKAEDCTKAGPGVTPAPSSQGTNGDDRSVAEVAVLEKIWRAYRLPEDGLTAEEREVADRLVGEGLVQKYGIYYQLTSEGVKRLEELRQRGLTRPRTSPA